jgi:hypothetical protein
MEALVKTLDKSQATRGAGYIHGVFDELSMLLSIFERSQTGGGNYSLDKARLLML